MGIAMIAKVNPSNGVSRDKNKMIMTMHVITHSHLNFINGIHLLFRGCIEFWEMCTDELHINYIIYLDVNVL